MSPPNECSSLWGRMRESLYAIIDDPHTRDVGGSAGVILAGATILLEKHQPHLALHTALGAFALCGLSIWQMKRDLHK